MKIYKANEFQKIDVPFEAKKLFSGTNLEIVSIHLKENETIPLHTMPMKVVFYVIEGSAMLLTEEKEIEINENCCIYFENPDEMRGWRCNEKQSIRLLVIKHQ